MECVSRSFSSIWEDKLVVFSTPVKELEYKTIFHSILFGNGKPPFSCALIGNPIESVYLKYLRENPYKPVLVKIYVKGYLPLKKRGVTAS